MQLRHELAALLAHGQHAGALDRLLRVDQAREQGAQGAAGGLGVGLGLTELAQRLQHVLLAPQPPAVGLARIPGGSDQGRAQGLLLLAPQAAVDPLRPGQACVHAQVEQILRRHLDVLAAELAIALGKLALHFSELARAQAGQQLQRGHIEGLHQARQFDGAPHHLVNQAAGALGRQVAGKLGLPTLQQLDSAGELLAPVPVVRLVHRPAQGGPVVALHVDVVAQPPPGQLVAVGVSELGGAAGAQQGQHQASEDNPPAVQKMGSDE